MTGSNDVTTADFSIAESSNNGYAPTTIQFANSSEFADSYSWNFDDPTSGSQNTSTEAEPSHTFQNPGTYDVRLTARSIAGGQEDVFSMSIAVEMGNSFWRTYDYSNQNLDEAKDVIQTRDGGYAITGNSYNGANQDVLLIITDPEGNPVAGSPRRFDAGSGDFGDAIIQTQSGGYAIVGRMYPDAVLILTDADGNELPGSPVRFGSEGFDVAEDIIETQSGGFAITGTLNGDLMLILTDDAGNVQAGFPKVFDFATNGDTGRSIIQTEDGGFAIVGTSNNGTDSEAILILTDENGNQLPGSPRRYDSGTGPDGSNGLVQTQQGGFAIGGYGHDGSEINAWLILTDQNGNALSGSPKSYDTKNGGNYQEGFEGIVRTSSGGFGLIGYTYEGGDYDLFLLLTDGNGNALAGSPKSYAPAAGTTLRGRSIIQTLDGGFAMVGTSESSAGKDVLFIKTDAQGEVSN